MSDLISKSILISKIKERAEIHAKDYHEFKHYSGDRKIRDIAKWEECEVVIDILEKESTVEIESIYEEESEENEFCEWLKYDYRTIAPKNHDIGNPYWRIPDNMDRLKYCPYCGKEIKVE